MMNKGNKKIIAMTKMSYSRRMNKGNTKNPNIENSLPLDQGLMTRKRKSLSCITGMYVQCIFTIGLS